MFSVLEEFVPPLPVTTRHAFYELVMQHLIWRAIEATDMTVGRWESSFAHTLGSEYE